MTSNKPLIASVENAVVLLQSTSSSVEDRLNALRLLRNYIRREDGQKKNPLVLSKLNRLVLDNVLAMIMGEDQTIDLRLRQYVRAESLIILSDILEAPSIFDDAKRRLDELSGLRSEMDNDRSGSSITSLSRSHGMPGPTSAASSSSSLLRPSSPGQSLASGITEPSMRMSQENDMRRQGGLIVSKSNSVSDFGTPYNGVLHSVDMNALTGRPVGSSRGTPGFSGANLIRDRVKPKIDRLRIKKKLFRPRASIMYGSSYEMQRILPGEKDRSNWIEQDKKLGYQKSRMWYPVANIGVDAMMLPKPRPEALASDNVVQEYLQMRALLSYVGDVVLYPPPPPGKAVALARGTGKIETSAYRSAIREAMQYWQPLIGASQPIWAKQKSGIARVVFEEEDANNPYTQIIHNFGSPAKNRYKEQYADSDERRTLRSSFEKNVIWTKKVLRNLLKKEISSKSKTSDTLRSILHSLVESSSTNNAVSPAKLVTGDIKRVQASIDKSLRQQRDVVDASVNGLQTLMQETVKLQYASMPPRYIMVLEKSEKNPRDIVRRMLEIFIRVKSRNFLSIGMGIWKICLLEKAFEQSKLKYSKKAGAQLMLLWVKRKLLSLKLFWINRWRRNVTQIIFSERIPAVVRIQTVYRMWRDKRIFFRLHKIASYNGPLSDIYLGPYNPNLRFKISKEIRDNRRMYWLAATVVQARYRGLLARRWYWEKLYTLILLQSICRMWPKYCYYRRLKAVTIMTQARVRRLVKRIQFKRLKKATIIVQKYVRRLLGLHLKWIRLRRRWRIVEIKLGVIIFLQCRIREKIARRKVKEIQLIMKAKQRAALKLQTMWYKHKNAFHTFLLMCCYRSIDEIERMAEMAGKKLGRGFAARALQRYYKVRYYYRLISSANTIQRWYRGACGYNTVILLRRKKWASRKLHHWARGMLKFKNKCVRIIQRAWWNYKPGTLLKHLHYRLFTVDKLRDETSRNKRYEAASRIQAILKGMRTRTWIKYDSAARMIQRPMRFFIFRQRCKREARARNRRFVTKIVGNIIGRGLLNRTLQLVEIQNRVIVKPQALMRGALVRLKMLRAKQFAAKFGMAVIKIQRCMRNNGAMLKAVQEMMAIKRMDDNPFRICERAHSIINQMRKETDVLYTTRDYRCGLRVHTFLQRMGLTEFIGMFPKKDFTFAHQLKDLSGEFMIKLYDQMQERMKKEAKKKGADEGATPVRKQKTPTGIFDTIIAALKPKFSVKEPKSQEISRSLGSVTDVMSPNDLHRHVRVSFTNRFGKQMNTRATNLADKMVELAFTNYNNYRGVVNVLTKAIIDKAITTSGNIGDVKTNIEEMMNTPSLPDDFTWDTYRVRRSADLLELASERLLAVLEYGVIRSLVERALVRVQQYRRKFVYVLNHLKELAKKARIAELKAQAVAKLEAVGKGQKKKTKVKPVNSSTEEVDEVELIVKDRSKVLSTEESLELEFGLEGENYVELEQNMSICKILFEMFDKLELASLGIQKLKNIWSIKVMSRLVRQNRIKKFLTTQHEKYLEDRNTDKVRLTWEKFRKIEAANDKLQEILHKSAAKRGAVEENLQWSLRYGWTEKIDEQAYPYYEDTTGQNYPTYERPTYYYYEYLACCKIQAKMREKIYRMHERKRLKEEARLLEYYETEQAWKQDIAIGGKLLKFKLRLTLRSYIAPEDLDAQPVQTFTFQESYLPYHLRFVEKPVWKSGDWGFLRSEDETMYEIVMVFLLRNENKLCDVRTVKGRRYVDIPTVRLFRNYLEVGSKVEARYRAGKLFYRGTISAVYELNDVYTYTILYDDGEKETGIDRSMIRSSQSALESFLIEREYELNQLDKRLMRLKHFSKLKAERLRRISDERLVINSQFNKNWSKINGIALEPPPTPIDAAEDDGGNNGVDKRKPGSPSTPNRPKDGKPGSPSTPNRPSKSGGKSRSSKKTKEVAQVILEPGETLLEMIEASDQLNCLTTESVCSIEYTRRALKYGWRAISEETDGRKTMWYTHEKTDERTLIPPYYTVEENFGAKKFQGLFQYYKSKKNFKKLLQQESIPIIVENCIAKYQTLAYIGYRLEGVTTTQILYRAGLWELANLIEATFNGRPSKLRSITLQYIVNLKKANYGTIGLTDSEDHFEIVKSLMDFQRWYKRSTPAQFEASMGLFNYWKGPDDGRQLESCILESENYVFKRLDKAMPNNVTRCRSIAKSIVSSSSFPHARKQLDSFCAKYAGKSGTAQDNFKEMVNKPTTHTWIEEAKAFKVLRMAVSRIGTVLGNLHLKGLRSRISVIEEKVDEMVKGFTDIQKRSLLPGPEAKAALLLRVEAIGFIESCTKAVVVVQTFIRCRVKRKIFIRKNTLRKWALGLLQRWGRGVHGRRTANFYRMQQTSLWEQLWDGKRKLLYYFNKRQKFSTYEEPTIPYRPLVRHRRSDELMQSWPHLDVTDSKVAKPPEAPPGSYIPPSKCQICNSRKTTRVCLDCTYIPEGQEGTENAEVPTAHCFTCFSKVHSTEPYMQNHRFHDATGVSEERRNLICSFCKDKPATRKCLGILDDRQIDEVCTELQRRNSHEWMDVLNKSNIAGERKLSIMLEQLKTSNTGKQNDFLSPSQLQQVRTMLERTRAECDEVYCADCYKEVHSAGKRMLHKWTGFNAFAPPCEVCYRSACEVTCIQCTGVFCKSCFKVFHSKGRKRKHVSELIIESVESPEADVENIILCQLCERRVATEICENNCKFHGCNSCYECIHKPQCDTLQGEPTTEDKPYFECVVCKERADQQCVQCTDYYCSLTWMGNPGCFVKMHRKGNRAVHTTCEIDPALEAAKMAAFNQKSRQQQAAGKADTPSAPQKSRTSRKVPNK